MRKRKKLQLSLALLALLAITITTVNLKSSNIFGDKIKKSASSIESAVNKCPMQETDFLDCIDAYLPLFVENTDVNNIERSWVEKTVKHNWPGCHDALHKLGHLLPDLTPKELRKSTSGTCAYGLLMGYIERDMTNLSTNQITSLNNRYCLPELDKKIRFADQCTHVIGHLYYFQTNKNEELALKLCNALKYHSSQCATGVFMRHFENRSSNAAITPNP